LLGSKSNSNNHSNIGVVGRGDTMQNIFFRPFSFCACTASVLFIGVASPLLFFAPVFAALQQLYFAAIAAQLLKKLIDFAPVFLFCFYSLHFLFYRCS